MARKYRGKINKDTEAASESIINSSEFINTGRNAGGKGMEHPWTVQKESLESHDSFWK